MASIQQSMNQLIGTAASAFADFTRTKKYFDKEAEAAKATEEHRQKQMEELRKQSPEYQRQEELKGIKSQREALYNAQMELGGEAGDQMGDDGRMENTPAWRAMKSFAEKEIDLAKRQLELDPTEANAKDLARLQRDYEVDYPSSPKENAENKGLDRLVSAIEGLRNQSAGVADRLETLRSKASAKERGQIDTAINRLRKKGEFD